MGENIVETRTPNDLNQLNKDQIIALMGVYANEWIHRDDLFWKEFFSFFYANLVVIILPNIATKMQIELPPIGTGVFRIAGMLMAVFFCYITRSNAYKLLAAKVGYEKLMELLGDEKYKRPSHITLTKHQKIFSVSVARHIAPVMFVILAFVSLVLLLVS